MAISTTTGSGTLTTLLVSTGTDLVVPENESVSLLQNESVTITGSGTNVLFLGRVSTTDDGQCQANLTVDSTTIYSDATGQQIIARLALGAGSHTITFTAFALSNDVTANVFGLTIVDLGL
jgi:hypothetical protein